MVKLKPCIQRIAASKSEDRETNQRMIDLSVLYSTITEVDGHLLFWLTITMRYSLLISPPMGIRTSCWDSIGSCMLGVSTFLLIV